MQIECDTIFFFQRSLNPSQLDVVLSVAHAVRQPYVEPKICLIQGPPGTGKSHTIITLIRTILKQVRSLKITDHSLGCVSSVIKSAQYTACDFMFLYWFMRDNFQ